MGVWNAGFSHRCVFSVGWTALNCFRNRLSVFAPRLHSLWCLYRSGRSWNYMAFWWGRESSHTTTRSLPVSQKVSLSWQFLGYITTSSGLSHKHFTVHCFASAGSENARLMSHACQMSPILCDMLCHQNVWPEQDCWQVFYTWLVVSTSVLYSLFNLSVPEFL